MVFREKDSEAALWKTVESSCVTGEWQIVSEKYDFKMTLCLFLL